MLYFRGCTAREKQTDIAKATERLLEIAGVDFHTLDDEKCCGSVLLRTGFTDEAAEQIKKNTEILKDEKIITSCAGCYKTLKDDYEGLDVIHISQLLDELIKEGKLKLSKSDLEVTYHDSCHLGRHSNVFDEPRNVIRSVANLVEMENNHENSLCCGAGGGVKSAYPEIAGQMAQSRIAQAKETGCDTLVTPCPFCKLNLENDDMEVLDLTEFLVKYGDVDEGK
ncbi:(Fe-S)-binding protein [Methanobrevibacter sp.]|uniref:(Fe-S)-binding protein n=1 Tax=Methanobrevibacter sp. TaxID=66852 RepID=UPI003865595D